MNLCSYLILYVLAFIAKLKLGNNGIHRGDQKISSLMNDQEHVVDSICRETDNRTESVASTSYNNNGGILFSNV